MFLETSYEAISVLMSCSDDKEMYEVCCMCRVVGLFINHYYVDVSVVVEKDSLAVTIKLTTWLLFQIYQTERSLINCFGLFCVGLDQPPFSFVLFALDLSTNHSYKAINSIINFLVPYLG